MHPSVGLRVLFETSPPAEPPICFISGCSCERDETVILAMEAAVLMTVAQLIALFQHALTVGGCEHEIIGVQQHDAGRFSLVGRQPDPSTIAAACGARSKKMPSAPSRSPS